MTTFKTGTARQDRIDSLARQLKMPVENFDTYHDGFSFTTPEEVDAYRAAYIYQGRRVVVKPSPRFGWLVQVYEVIGK